MLFRSVSYRKNVGTAVSAIILTLLYSNHYYNEFSALTSFSLPTNTQGTKHTIAVGVPDAISTDEAHIRLLLSCSGINVTSIVASIIETAQLSQLFACKDDVGMITATSWGFDDSGPNDIRISVSWARNIVGGLKIKMLLSATLLTLLQLNGLGIDSEYH